MLHVLRYIVALVAINSSFSHFCKLNEFSFGRWLPIENITRKAFICCGWDALDWTSAGLENECGVDAIDNRTAIFGKRDTFVHVGGHSCFCDAKAHQRHTVSSREKCYWQPNDCKLLPWSGSQFCELLGKKKVMFIGDSTMVQTAATVMNMLLGDTPKGTCGKQLFSYQINYLSEGPELMKEALAYFQPHIVIISFGPHYHDIKSFRQDLVYLANNISDIQPLLTNRPSFYWKTINSPHWLCHKYQVPISNFSFNPPLIKDTYDWKLFPIFDDISMKFFPLHNFQILDATMLRLRPDSHPGLNGRTWIEDCLHYCLPGPLNVFGTMVQHLLYHSVDKK